MGDIRVTGAGVMSRRLVEGFVPQLDGHSHREILHSLRDKRGLARIETWEAPAWYARHRRR